MLPYQEKYVIGTKVQVASKDQLEAFLLSWKYHHKLTSAQLQYADRLTEVAGVSFYHGGDVLYELKDVPGIWHEQCLK
jgi:hypothetical protein